MCGIVGYIGDKKSLPILMEGLKALEYRGYDSAGIAMHSAGHVISQRSVGHVALLEQKIDPTVFSGTAGIAHTRWATHGEPSQANAHPHADCSNTIFVVHNGIIENYKDLKKYLSENGHVFRSETDTEVIAHLIEEYRKKTTTFRDALLQCLKNIRGTYGLAVIDGKNPDVLYAAKFQSPLVIGVGKGEYFVASDPSAIVGHTRDVMYLQDSQIAEITREKLVVTDFNSQLCEVPLTHLAWDVESFQKGEYPHFMLKEIFEGPEAIRSAFAGRLDVSQNQVKLGGLEAVADRLKNVQRILILACGTSYHAGLIGEYFFEEIAKIPTEVQFASEFRYKNEPFEKGTIAIVISQSGETADTIAALRKAQEKGLLTLGIVNVVGSTIARQTDAGIYNHAGPEICVASTKAFISQVTILALMAHYFSQDKNAAFLKELAEIPGKISNILAKEQQIKALAEKYTNYKNFMFLGRRYGYPTALEGALKLKELSYIHAEGYGAGELKHGPIALINKEFASIAIVPDNSVSEKMYSNLEEIKARKGPILAIATEGDEKITSIADDTFYIPKTLEPFEPLLAVVPLQLFAYHVAIQHGCNVDKPRNLAKSVTVE
jgi:glucosamine--fructose-6-phosphate aminotransferase (isomerizing)